MNLRTWISQFPMGKRAEAVKKIAIYCDVTPAAVRHWSCGIRNVPFEKLPQIEAATKGAVTRHHIYPNFPWGKVKVSTKTKDGITTTERRVA